MRYKCRRCGEPFPFTWGMVPTSDDCQRCNGSLCMAVAKTGRLCRREHLKDSAYCVVHDHLRKGR
jgi:hypothetical protein